VVTRVLDASAILRFLDKQAGALRVAEIIRNCFEGHDRVVVSSIQWGEVAYILHRRRGANWMEVALTGLLDAGLEIIPATQKRAVRSGIIRATRKIPYADAFAVELAGDSSDHVLVTADFDMKPAENDVRIEFLPANPRPA
jgi:predicted nucleic acid-binding protein